MTSDCFSAFEYDLTTNLKYGNQEILITVKVDHSMQSSCCWLTSKRTNKNINNNRFMKRGIS